MMSTMVMVGLALLTTVFILRCYHSTGTPPRYMSNFLRCFTKRRKILPKNSVQMKIHVKNVAEKKQEVASEDESNVETFAQSKESPFPRKEDDPMSWQTVSEKFNYIFFWVFFVVAIVLYVFGLGILTKSG